jgi:dolichyl-diphosphooligosaccharide--protein glycosyltransferase
MNRMHMNNATEDNADAAAPEFSRPSRLWAVVLLSLLVLPTAWDALYFAQSSVPDAAGDWRESLVWLKENSNATSFFDSPQKSPEYSVMTWWDYGNWVLYMAERPVVTNNFQAGLVDAAKFYLSENEEEATSVLDRRKSKYILTDYSLIYAKLAAITAWTNEDIGSYMRAEDDGTQFTIVPQERLFNTTLARLYLFDGAGMSHFRLIHESKTFMGDSPAKSKVKIFEYVPGALIRVRSDPDKKVGALLNMTSNQGRPFIYVNEAQAVNGSFEIRVPYSTEKRDGCHATNPYLVFSGNKDELNTKDIEVSEQDVYQGRIIELTL